MDIKPFFTERFFDLHEFSAPYTLCASDCESMTIEDLLGLAGVSPDRLGTLWLGYTEAQGAPALREAIAGLYANVNAGQVVGLAAPEEGIFITMQALLERGDHVIVLTPNYDSLANVAEHLGCQVSRWKFSEATGRSAASGGWQLELHELEQALTKDTRLVVVNFPHNPTGYLPTHDEWQDLVQIVARSGAWLLSDEMYRGLEYDPAQRLAPGCDLYERAITLGGLSKTYGLPGLRSGWLALQDQTVRDRLLGWKAYTTICASAPSEALALIALAVGEELAARSRRIILANLALVEPFFERHADTFRWNPPRAGSVALVGLRDRSAAAFSDRLVSEQGVILLPSTGLGIGDGHVRFGFGRHSFSEALEQLEFYLAQQEVG